MSYGICVRSNKAGKFLDFVVANTTSTYVRRVTNAEISKRKREVKQSEREAMEQSLKIAMYDLDYRSRNGFPIHRDWKKVASKVVGIARIGGV
jgi:hypothetical protein